MCPGNLARQIHVVIGDVRLWVPRPVLELHFQTTAELVEIDLRPIDAEFAANPLGHGDTYSLFFGLYGTVLFRVQLVSSLPTRTYPDVMSCRAAAGAGCRDAMRRVLDSEILIIIKALISRIQFYP